MRDKTKIPLYISAAALIAVSFLSFFSFNYFYLYGHIESLSDLVFCLLSWLKLAGIAVCAAAVFLKSKRFSVVLKYFYIILPLVSLFWINRYCGLVKIPLTETEHIFFNINNILPPPAVKILFVSEAALLSLTALLTAFKEGFAPKTELKRLVWLLPVLALTLPFNILENLVRLLPPQAYRFFLFKNFSVWHFASLLVLVGSTVVAYLLLKNKSSEERHKRLSLLAVILLIQYMSKASMLIGDGYNVYDTLFAFIPLFVCNLGVIVAAVAIFTKSKLLSDLSFFVHAGGAISVFVYFGKESMSDFGTVFSFSFLYFTFTHAALFVLCVMPVLLKEQRFRLKDCLFPLVYYAAFIFVAAAVGQVVSGIKFSYGKTFLNIFPNYSFTQNSPIENKLPKVLIRLFGMEFDILYLAILFFAYVLIFFAFYFLYYFAVARRTDKGSLGAEGRRQTPKRARKRDIVKKTKDDEAA